MCPVQVDEVGSDQSIIVTVQDQLAFIAKYGAEARAAHNLLDKLKAAEHGEDDCQPPQLLACGYHISQHAKDRFREGVDTPSMKGRVQLTRVQL